MENNGRINNFINAAKRYVDGFKKCTTQEEIWRYLEDEEEYYLNVTGTNLIDDGFFKDDDEVNEILKKVGIDKKYYEFGSLW